MSNNPFTLCVVSGEKLLKVLDENTPADITMAPAFLRVREATLDYIAHAQRAEQHYFADGATQRSTSDLSLLYESLTRIWRGIKEAQNNVPL